MKHKKLLLVLSLTLITVVVWVALSAERNKFQSRSPSTATVQLPSAAHIRLGEARFLVKGDNPTWSPDGQWIAFSSDGYIRVIKPDGSKPARQLGDQGSSFHEITWSPDSREVFYKRRFPSGKFYDSSIESVNIFTENVTNYPQFSEDTRVASIPNALYFGTPVVYFNPRTNLYHARTFDGKDWIVTINRDRISDNLGFIGLSPSGQHVMMLYGIYDIYGSGLIYTRDYGAAESWSPDGKKIIYHIPEIDESGHHEINSDLYVVNIDNTEHTQLTFTPNRIESSSNWSPDGNQVTYTIEGEGIYIADVIFN